MKNICKLLFCLLVVFAISCRKYLDKKSDINLNTPSSLADYQYLVDNEATLLNTVIPQVGDIACDDYSIKEAFFNSSGMTVAAKNSYLWKPDIWAGQNTGDWDNPYKAIYYSNVVLEGIKDFKVNTQSEQLEKNNIIGHALFIRAHMHYFLEETFGQPYRPATAGTDLGVPLRITSAVEVTIARATTEAVYNQMISDLKEAASKLPVTAIAVSRPSKATALALLARVYLTKQDYVNAEIAATACLQALSSDKFLLDYNHSSVSKTSSTPFSNIRADGPTPVPEILYACTPRNYGFFVGNGNGTNVIIDTNLYNLYHNDDWRKTVYYQKPGTSPNYYLKGDYWGPINIRFYGIALNEVYLVRAECRARTGNKDLALADLDTLLKKRWKNTVPFPVSTAVDAEEALRKILIERRKELIFRGLRWIDLRRLNQDPRFAVTIKHMLGAVEYTLAPNDHKYTYPIPDNEINITGIPQNPR